MKRVHRGFDVEWQEGEAIRVSRSEPENDTEHVILLSPDDAPLLIEIPEEALAELGKWHPEKGKPGG